MLENGARRIGGAPVSATSHSIATRKCRDAAMRFHQRDHQARRDRRKATPCSTLSDVRCTPIGANKVKSDHRRSGQWIVLQWRSITNVEDVLMRILQPADWSKPRGFSHGVVSTAPAVGSCWLARPAATKRRISNRHGWAGRRCAASNHSSARGGRSRSRTHRPPDLVSDQPKRIRGRGRRYRSRLARDARPKFSAFDAALHRLAWSMPAPRSRSKSPPLFRPDRRGEKIFDGRVSAGIAGGTI